MPVDPHLFDLSLHRNKFRDHPGDAARDAPCPDVVFGGILLPVLYPADLGVVQAGQLGKSTPGEARILAEVAESDAESLLG
ncbi:hypothetical protein GCM10009560_78400 [Nonomuraea longicatena]|uniref:Uncharacterized protein n=1 Tax=Nonomuraea longicatena TaxID=83682 RepID=A0ABN1RBN1_9ACTN